MHFARVDVPEVGVRPTRAAGYNEQGYAIHLLGWERREVHGPSEQTLRGNWTMVRKKRKMRKLTKKTEEERCRGEQNSQG